MLLTFSGLLRQKDVEQALLLQEKMALQLKLLATAGLGPPSSPPSYRHLVSENTDTGVMWKEVLNAVQVRRNFYLKRFYAGNIWEVIGKIIHLGRKILS